MTNPPSAPSAASAAASRLRNEKGAATAEYAVATVAGCGFAALLMELLGSDFGQMLLETILNLILGLVGLRP